MQLTGDFAGLKKIEAKLRAAKDAYDALPKVLSEQAVSLTRMGFRRATDPYGAGWAGISHRAGKPLNYTGALRGSIYRRSSAGRFSVGIGGKYAGVHQNGATIRAKNTRRVEYTRRNSRGRNAKGGLKRRGKGFGAYHNVVAFRKALTFQIGGKWISTDKVTIKRRMMVPTAGRGLPHTWSTAFQRTVNQKLKRHFR